MADDIKWYALYLRSRSEKRVAKRLSESGHESFLPMVKMLKIWSDRRKWVLEPLMKSYIFVRVNRQEIYNVLLTEGVVRIVSFSGEPAPIPDKQIENLKKIIDTGEEVTVTTETFAEGEMVKVVSGPLKGLSGMLTELKGKYRMVMKIDNLDCSILVTINANNIRKIPIAT